jgi:hypothetical protein
MSNSPSLYCLKRRNTASNKLEVHTLSGADNFQTFSLHTDTAIFLADAPNFDFAVADYNGDGHPDIFCLKKHNTSTGTVEVHVLNGADNFQTFLLHNGTPLGTPDCDFAVADYNGDGHPDVFGLKKNNTGTGTFQVHVLNGANNFQTFLLETGTPISTSDSADCNFAVADYNGDGHPDIFCLKKNIRDGTVEVRVLNGADNFQTFLLQTTRTPLGPADCDFAVADYNRDGHPDVFGLKKNNTGTGTFQVHVLNGADNFQTFLLEIGTLLSTSDSAENFLFTVADIPLSAGLPGFSMKVSHEFRGGAFPFVGCNAAGSWDVIEFSLDHTWAEAAATGVDIIAQAGYSLPVPLDALVPIELGIYAHEIGEKNQSNGVYVKINLPTLAIAGLHCVDIRSR